MNHYTLEQLQIGMTESFSETVTKERMDAFANLSGDVNPLHMDEAFAKERGFVGRVAYGMLTSSFYSALVGVYLPGEHCLLNDIQITFVKPVYIGEKLCIEGTISDIRYGTGRVRIEACIRNEQSEVVSKSVITVKLTA